MILLMYVLFLYFFTYFHHRIHSNNTKHPPRSKSLIRAIKSSIFFVIAFSLILMSTMVRSVKNFEVLLTELKINHTGELHASFQQKKEFNQPIHSNTHHNHTLFLIITMTETMESKTNNTSQNSQKKRDSTSPTISSDSSSSLNRRNSSRRRERRQSRNRSNSLTTSVKQQFEELVSTFESLIDGQIPYKSQASKLKRTVDAERKKLIELLKKRQNLVSQKFKQKTLKFRVNVQKSIRKRITGNENRSIRRHIQEPPQIKFIDKISFTLSVLTLLLSELFLLSYPRLFKFFYAAMLIPLMIARYIDYKDKKYHFFMFDFCYFINFVSISHIFFFPNRYNPYNDTYSYSFRILFLFLCTFYIFCM